jgi:hypothetical protein
MLGQRFQSALKFLSRVAGLGRAPPFTVARVGCGLFARILERAFECVRQRPAPHARHENVRCWALARQGLTDPDPPKDMHIPKATTELDRDSSRRACAQIRSRRRLLRTCRKSTS